MCLITFYMFMYIWIFIRSINYLRIFFIFFFFGFAYSATHCTMKEAIKEEEEENRIKEESKQYLLFDKETEFIYTIV